MVGAVCSVGQVRRITLSLSASINVYPKNRRSLPTILEPGLPSGPFLICSSGKWIWHCRPQPNLPADQSDYACLIMLKYVRFNQYLSADLIQFAHTWSPICDQSQLHFRCSHIVNLLPDLMGLGRVTNTIGYHRVTIGGLLPAWRRPRQLWSEPTRHLRDIFWGILMEGFGFWDTIWTWKLFSQTRGLCQAGLQAVLKDKPGWFGFQTVLKMSRQILRSLPASQRWWCLTATWWRDQGGTQHFRWGWCWGWFGWLRQKGRRGRCWFWWWKLMHSRRLNYIIQSPTPTWQSDAFSCRRKGLVQFVRTMLEEHFT